MIMSKMDSFDSKCLGPALVVLEDNYLMSGAVLDTRKQKNGAELFMLNLLEIGPFDWNKADFKKIDADKAIKDYDLKGYLSPDDIEHMKHHGFCWVLKLKVA